MGVKNLGRKLHDLWFYKCEWKILVCLTLLLILYNQLPLILDIEIKDENIC